MSAARETVDDLLTIPPFLRRTPGDRGAQSAQERRNEVETDQDTPENGESDADAPPAGYEAVTIHNHGHTGKLPEGRRIVRVKRGRKWVRIWRGPHRNQVKVLRSIFDRMVKEDET